MIVHSTAFAFGTGREPGYARQTGQVRVFSGSEYATSQRQNIFVRVFRWMWISSPMTGSQFTGTSRDEVEADRPLQRVAGAEEQVLGELRADQLEADREPFREAAGNREPGQARHVRRDREHVREVHRERVLRLLAELEGDGRRGRTDEDVELLEGGCVLLRDHGANPLRLTVVGVVVAGRERVGAEHDPALRLVAEAGVARLLVHLANVGSVDPQPVADAVVPGQVRGSLGGSHEVVAGEPELDRAREARLPHLGAELAAELDRPVDRPPSPRARCPRPR